MNQLFLPATFTNYPWSSVLQNHESEMIARNIMIILTRTGNEFRELTWDEYKTERLKDGQFTENEKRYFDQVSYLALGDIKKIQNFSDQWKENLITPG